MRSFFTNFKIAFDKHKYLLVIAAFAFSAFLPSGASAQQRTVTGKVTDELGAPMSGVTVIVKGTSMGTTTLNSGEYSVTASADAVLEFNFLGYEKQEQPVHSKRVVDIRLNPSAVAVKELVVVGYGSMERRSINNATTKVTPDDFVSGAANPIMALQGKVPGLSISSTMGSDPNADTNIQLRGLNSVNNVQSTLILIDGVQGEISQVAKEDIESITVLKDASAGSIYGTRATGGVILITTKRAQRGTFKLTYNTELSVENLYNLPKLLNADEFRAYGRAANNQDYGGSTDWLKEVTTQNAFKQRHVVSTSGATEKVGFTASVNVLDAAGTLYGSARNEFGARVSGFAKLLNDRIEVNANMSYNQIKADLSDMDLWGKALRLNPTIPLYASEANPDQKPTGRGDRTKGYWMLINDPTSYNPVAERAYMSNELEKTYFQGSATVKFNITKDWNIQAMGALRQVQENTMRYYSKQHRIALVGQVGDINDGQAYHKYAKSTTKLLEVTTNYTKQFDDHYINAVAGYSFQEDAYHFFDATDGGFEMDGLNQWNLGDGIALSDGKATMNANKNPRERLIGFFARVNYDWKDRYLITVSARYEGTSKFYDNRWGLFPGVSAGWRVSNEPFMQDVAWVDDLKLRASFGITGNASVNNLYAYRTYSPGGWTYFGGNWVRTMNLGYSQNRDLKWEKKVEWNIGVDFSFLDHRLTGSLDWYNRNINDLIYNQIPVPSPPNYDQYTDMNVGSMSNSGVELELTGKVVQRKNFDYTTSFTLNHTSKAFIGKLKQEKFIDMPPLPHPSPGSAGRVYPGQEIGSFLVYKGAGFDEDGYAYILDNDGQKIKYSAKDEYRRKIGNAIPKVMLSWMNNFRYKWFDMSLYFRSWIGHDIYNVQDMYLGVSTSTNVKSNVTENAYRADRNAQVKEPYMLTDYWIEKGSFLKLDNVTIGYTLPKGTVKWIDNLRVFFTVRNVFTLTSFTGTDPEVDITGLFPGFAQLNAYPNTRTMMLGVQIGF